MKKGLNSNKIFLSFIFLFPIDVIAHQTLIAFVLGGMVAGTTGTYSVTIRSFLAYSLPALLPVVIRFFIIGDDIHIAMGGMVLFFGILMFFTAKRINAVLDGLFSETRESTGIHVNFFVRNIPERFDPEKELAIYRIIQEALNNITKHAKAKNVYVSLLTKGEVISLNVEDDGIGFDQREEMKISKCKEALGLIIMQERAIQCDGEFTLESEMGKGTIVMAEIPI